MRGWTLTALAMLLLAGCQANPGGRPGVTAAPGDGAVQGIAVSSAIVPLSGVLVRLEPAGRTNVTDAQGRFAFERVAPGAYTLLANKTGYLSAQSAIEVASGPAAAPVKLQLDADTAAGRYFEAYSFDGLLDESFNVAGARGNSGNAGTNYSIGERAPDFIQSELVWQSTQSLGSDLDLTAIADDGNVTVPDFAQVEGPSPLLLQVDSTIIQQYHLGPRVRLELTVFSGQAEEPVPGKGAGVAASQSFRIITHMFFGYLPPDGWRFTSDGDPPPPA